MTAVHGAPLTLAAISAPKIAVSFFAFEAYVAVESVRWPLGAEPVSSRG